MRLALALMLTIRATLPVSEEIGDRMEELRQVAVKTGCPAERVRVSARWLGGAGGVEIEVYCGEASR